VDGAMLDRNVVVSFGKDLGPDCAWSA